MFINCSITLFSTISQAKGCQLVLNPMEIVPYIRSASLAVSKDKAHVHSKITWACDSLLNKLHHLHPSVNNGRWHTECAFIWKGFVCDQLGLGRTTGPDQDMNQWSPFTVLQYVLTWGHWACSPVGVLRDQCVFYTTGCLLHD